MDSSIIIGIAGGTGSGKTTLVKKLKEELGDEVLALTHDYYYKANSDKPFEERALLNYDHPHSFDTDMFIRDLIKLKSGQTIERPIYDFSLHTRAKETVVEAPTKVIIVEGILIFENVELRKLFDIKVFVDTDADVRIIRRLLRDVKERGRDLDSVISQYLNTVKIMHEEFVEPSKKYADIIIPEGGYNKVACSMLLDKIRTLLLANH
ncbi:MAG: uridine kinase [Vallitaleaceae bacterium]|nr:uridine kinase [Vallitaleaceae bacterium]